MGKGMTPGTTGAGLMARIWKSLHRRGFPVMRVGTCQSCSDRKRGLHTNTAWCFAIYSMAAIEFSPFISKCESCGGGSGCLGMPGPGAIRVIAPAWGKSLDDTLATEETPEQIVATMRDARTHARLTASARSGPAPPRHPWSRKSMLVPALGDAEVVVSLDRRHAARGPTHDPPTHP